MTEEELKEAEDILSGVTSGEWHLLLGREGIKKTILVKERFRLPSGEFETREVERINGVDPRWDIYSGPQIEESELLGIDGKRVGSIEAAKRIANKGRKQVAHFHPLHPMIWETNENYLNDAHFILFARKFIPRAVQEIRKLSKGAKDVSLGSG